MGAERRRDFTETVRDALKREHGRGWSIREKHGLVQLTRRLQDGSRSSVSLSIPWNPACTRPVLEAVSAIRQRMEAQQLGLKDAYRLIADAPLTEPGAMDWPSVVERYREHRITTGQIKETTYERDVRYRMEQHDPSMVVALYPTNFRGALKAAVEAVGLRWRYVGSEELELMRELNRLRERDLSRASA